MCGRIQQSAIASRFTHKRVTDATKGLSIAMLLQLIITSGLVVWMGTERQETVQSHYTTETCRACHSEASANPSQYYEWQPCNEIEDNVVQISFGEDLPNMSVNSHATWHYFGGNNLTASRVSSYKTHAIISLVLSILMTIGMIYMAKKYGFDLVASRLVILFVSTVGFVLCAYPTTLMFSLYISPNSGPLSPGCYVMMFNISHNLACIWFSVTFLAQAGLIGLCKPSAAALLLGVLMTPVWFAGLAIDFVMFVTMILKAGYYKPIVIFSCWFVIPILTLLLTLLKQPPPPIPRVPRRQPEPANLTLWKPPDSNMNVTTPSASVAPAAPTSPTAPTAPGGRTNSDKVVTTKTNQTTPKSNSVATKTEQTTPKEV